MKTDDLTGAALDWAVAKCEPYMLELYYTDTNEPLFQEEAPDYHQQWEPSTNWAQGGPIIEREMLEIGAHEPKDIEWVARDYWKENTMTGPTPLIAAMRCYVASKLGDDIEIPEELNQGEEK